ncbi:lytic murein transglycosylase B [Betaproteobacteria bacterium PRO7]|jgi:membrane-bound lytic murein transglycosylase B|nr:lytic murein transglycosylase B [Betaproteobacteria bacterium PRO7]
MNRRSFLVAASCAALGAPPFARAQALSYPLRGDVQEYIDAIVAAYGLERGWVERAIAQGRYSEAAERLTTPANAPPSARNWAEYRARNVDERRVREGHAFLRQHRAALARAAERYGVPESIVVAIIGIETFFGRVMGNLRTLDVLLTLAFDYTRRAPLYREELAQFLLLCREQGIDPVAPRGSFAGAIGLPQFMPGSVRRYAVDFDGDGRIDLAASREDAIGSVANFLGAHGWRRDLAVLFPAQADASVVEVLGRGIAAAYRWQDVAALGVTIDGTLPAEARVLLMDLPYLTSDGVEAVEYRVGTVNASALLHYNRSFFYATAVAELAQAVERRATETLAVRAAPAS